MKKLIFTCLMILLTTLSYADNQYAGATVANFLKLGAGAKAIGMGNSYTSIKDGNADMIYWNPAGLAFMTRKDLTLMYSTYFESMSYDWVAFAMPTIYGSFGLALQYFSSGDIDGYSTTGMKTPSYSAYDMAVYLSYAKKITFKDDSALGLGLNLKYINTKIDNSATAFAFDGGLIYTLKDGLTSFGATVQNIGTNVQYNNETESLPFTFKIGASRILFDNLVLGIDGVKPNDNDFFVALGAKYDIEVASSTLISLRAGYDGRAKDVDGFAGFNAGFGFGFKDLGFDYAFSPYGDLGDAHRISLSLKFGEAFNEKKLKEQKATDKTTNKKTKSSTTKKVESNKEIINNNDGEDEYEDEDEVEVEVTRDPNVVYVLKFISDQISQSELNAYTEMFKNGLRKTNICKLVNAKQESSYTQKLTKLSILKEFGKTDAGTLIVCYVKNENNKLKFEFSVYSRDLQSQDYVLVTEDSFIDTQNKLKDFAYELAN